MVIKCRLETVELKYLRYLNARTSLTEKDRTLFQHAKRGLAGEKKLDVLLENLSCECFIIQDLLLEFNNSVFQIDTVVIIKEKIYLLEIKNYEGVYYIENDHWYSENGNEIKNPLHQLRRSEALFKQSIKPLNMNFKIESYLIFTHPEFSLFQASHLLPIILPSQLNKFINQLSKSSSKISEKEKRISDYLIKNHLEKSPYTRIPYYNYEDLRKGVICPECDSFMNSSSRRLLSCPVCSFKEDLVSSVLRSIEEYKFLFPDRKISVSNIKKWSNLEQSNKIIRKILRDNYKLIKLGRFSYYI